MPAPDLRAQWIIEVVSMYLQYSQVDIECLIVDGGQYSPLLHSFFDCTLNHPALYFYTHTETGQLIIASDPPKATAKYLLYMVHRPIGDDQSFSPIQEPEGPDGPYADLTDEVRCEISQRLDISLISGNVLSSLATSLQNQYSPLVSAGDPEIMFQSRKLAVAASAADAQLCSKYVIEVPNLNISDPRVSAQDAAIVSTVQRLFEEWVQVLQAAMEEYDRLNPVGDLPMAELESWRKKSALLSNLYEDLCSPQFKKLFAVLEYSHSTVFSGFSLLRQDVARACLEAKDNARFLSTLERHFKMISRSPLPALSETITSLYAALRMVWTISRYYNTEDRLLPLMHRIAKHITARVRSSINIKELFSSSSRNAAILSGLAGQNFYGQGAIEALATNANETLGSSTFMDAGRRSLTKVSSSQIIPTTSTNDNYTPIDILYAAGQVLTKWKAQYNETKQKIEESTTDTKRWELDKRVLFGETDFHLTRVETLIGCVQSVMEFSQIISPDVQRVIGDQSGLREVRKAISELPSELIAFDQKIWSPSHTTEFEALLSNFKTKVSQTEVKAFSYIDRSFKRLRDVSSGLELVSRLSLKTASDAPEARGTAATTILSNHMSGKIEETLRQYCEELQRSIKEFELKKDQPPIGIDLPPLAASVVWARSLFVAVKEPYRIMRQLGDEVLKASQAATEATALFNELASNLRTFEQKRFQAWRVDADAIILKSLRSPLLGEKRILSVSDLRKASLDPDGTFLPKLVIPNLMATCAIQGTGQLTTAVPANSKDKVRRSTIRQSIPDSLPQHAAYADMTGATYLSPTVTSLILKEYGLEMCVNFPPELNALIDEVSALDRLGFRVGETALNVCLQKAKYETHAEGLKVLISSLNSALQDFLPLVAGSTPATVSDIKRKANSMELIRKSVSKAAVVIGPGFGPLNWNSLSVDDYLERALSACSELSQSCQQILKTIMLMEQCIKGITNTRLIPTQAALLLAGASTNAPAPLTESGAGGASTQLVPPGSNSSASGEHKPTIAEIMARATQLKKKQQLEGKRPDSPTTLFLAALKSLEARGKMGTEEEYESIPTMSLPEFSSRLEEFRAKSLMGSLEKYYSLGPLLVKIEELSFGTSTGKCPGLRTYYEYWTNRVYNALVVMIGTALKDFSILLRGVNTQSERDLAKRNSKYLRDRYTPLFQLNLSLSSPEIIVTPSLSSILNTLNNQVEQLVKVACPFVIWIPGSIAMHEPEPATSATGAEILSTDENATSIRRNELYGFKRKTTKQGDGQDVVDASSTEEVVVRSYSPRVSQHSTITMLATQLKSKIQSSILDIQEYIRAWSHYEQIWKSNRLSVVGRFAALSPNASTFDYVLSFFTATMDVLKDAHKEKMAIYTDIQADTMEAEALTGANDMSRPSRPSTTNRPGSAASASGKSTAKDTVDGDPHDSESHTSILPTKRHMYLSSNYIYTMFNLTAASDNLIDAIPVNNSISIHPPIKVLFNIAVLHANNLVKSIIHECQLWREAICRAIIEKARPMLLDSYNEIDEEFRNCVAQARDLESLKVVLSTLRRVANRTMSMELTWLELESLFALLQAYNAEVRIKFDKSLLSGSPNRGSRVGSPTRGGSTSPQLTAEQLEQRKRDAALYSALQPLVLEFENDDLEPILDQTDLGWSGSSLRELINLSDTDPRLCNAEIGVALTSGAGGAGTSLTSSMENLTIFTSTEEGAAAMATAAKSKKAMKTTNVRVFEQEIQAAYAIRSRWTSLLSIVKEVDRLLVEIKRKQAEETTKLARVFEKEMHAFVKEFNEEGPYHYLTVYFEEAAQLEQEGKKHTKTLTDILEDVFELYKASKEKFGAIVVKRDTTILAQRLFNLDPINSMSLTPIEKELDAEGAILAIYDQVRQTFKEWDRLYFSSLDPSMLETGCDGMRTTLRRLPAEYRSHTMYETLDTILRNYKDSIPLLQDLRNDALRARHWLQVEQLTGQTLFSNAEQAQNLTLGQLTSLDLSRYTQQINEIVVGARKELSIEKGLADIAEVWTKTRMPVKRYENAKGQDRGFILKALDDILLIIEDNSLNLQSMSASKYVAHFSNDVRLWEKRLSIISDVLEAWIICQRQWLYLEGIFSGSEDLKVQLPEEANRFERIDNSYLKLMSEIGKTNTSVLDAAQANGRLALLKSLIAQMETCQKALTDYLNSKRSLFTRFYFISDDELLFLLGNSSDPAQVQTHLRKMFEGVQTFQFQRGSTSTVIAVNSPEGEYLPLNQTVKIDTSTMPIETWMTAIDNEIKNSMKLHIKTGIFDFGNNYNCQTRVEWVKKHYGQVSLVASMIWWVFDAESAFKDLETGENMGAMKATASRYSQQIENLVLEIRKNLSKHDRLKINTLIIEDMHNRDLLDRFVRDSIISASSFDWESQLRFYWDRIQDTILVKQSSNSPIIYSYEYLGLTTRLVLTPLTDRCIITINTALSNFLGGAPAGPAGTGKTESVKDLAKQLGIFCLILNCSEGMDYKSFGSILSGISESGVWLCCDEFNRIDAPVLSVISGQIKIIQVGLMAMAKAMNSGETTGPNVGRIHLEGREIDLKPTSSIFITMNPGYAGRTELPDNLKALFRPIIMTKPDNAIIAEVMFLAEGFLQSRVLSKKMTVLYQLASEQLSKQYHYDFGLRALKSVLVNAGKLKRSDPDANEELLLMRALRDMNLPKFVFEDVPLFMGLINDLCPNIKLEAGETSGSESGKGSLVQIYTPEQEQALIERGPGTIREAAYLSLKENGYELLPNQLLKVEQTYETMQARHSVMIVGPSQGGKSVILNTFAAANTKLGCKTVFTTINPKAIPVSEVYGVLNPDTREWIDGLLSKIFRNINDPSFYLTNPMIANAVATNPSSILVPILFDGDVDAIWIESMNSVMDDSKLLTLPNSERIRLQDWCKLLFEVSDLQYASPATVSRCGMVWVDTKNLGYEPRFKRWIRERFDNSLSRQNLDDTGSQPNGTKDSAPDVDTSSQEEAKQLILSLYEKYIPPLIDYVLNGVKLNSSTGQIEIVSPLRLIYATSDISMVSQFCNIFDDIVKKAEQCKHDEILYSKSTAEEEDPLTNKPGDKADSSQPFHFSDLNDPMTLEALFIFTLVWSIGGLIHDQDRTSFDLYLRELSGLPLKSGISVSETVSSSHLPGGMITASGGSTLGAQQTSTLYDFYFDLKRNYWCPWSQFVKPYAPPSDGRFSSIIVATLDTVRNSWLLDTMMRNDRNVLFIGESGNAKTTIAKSFLNSLSPDHYITLGLNFSSRTMSIDIQVALEDNLDRRSKDTLGPPGGRKMILFTDELSMPVVDTYGTMQSIAALKLLVEKKGLFDRNPKSLMWRKILDVYILGCLKPVGGSSNKLDPRFVSNFSVLNISTPIEDSLNHIYNSILVTHMKDCNYQFDSSGDPENNLRHITTISKKITAATLSVYNTILHTLSPTPSRFHYLFNLRDLSRVYEGLCMALPEKFPTFASLVKLWKNEFMRVFADRLICPEDHSVVSQQLTTKIAEFFGDVEGIESVAKEPLIYGDFRELPLLLDNYEAVKMGVDPENKCFRMYEELIEGNPIQRDADPTVPIEADQGATVVDSMEGQEEGTERKISMRMALLT